MSYFWTKLTFEMLTVRGKQHSFSTHERMFMWKCQSFSDRKCLDLRGTRTPNLRIHAECSNHLSYQGHWGRNKMADILQAIFWNAFSHFLERKKSLYFGLSFAMINHSKSTRTGSLLICFSVGVYLLPSVVGRKVWIAYRPKSSSCLACMYLWCLFLLTDELKRTGIQSMDE